jgi:hypothetical protein
MNIKPVVILAACAFFFTGGCNKSPTSTTANNSGNQQPPPVQAEPFHGQVYKSLDGRTTLTLVSKEECELSENGTILLCKYTKPNDTLRVVTTALGTSQVIYYRFTDQGIQDNNGNVLLSQERYAAIIQQQQLEKQRKDELLNNSKAETKIINTFSLNPINENDANAPDQLILTDVSMKFHWPVSPWQKTETNEVVYFVNLENPVWNVKSIGDVQGPSFDCYSFNIYYIRGLKGMATLRLKSNVELQGVHDAVLNTYNAWKAKFPNAVAQ